MRKILVTGFTPFGEDMINPAWEAVKKLPKNINDLEVTKQIIPTVFGNAAIKAITKAEEIGADIVLSIGLAGGRDAITPEMVAINLRHAVIEDNHGYMPKDETIVKDGENAYFTGLDIRKAVDKINEAGIKAQVSYSAGTFVCNDVFYCLSDHFKGTKTKVGFCHIPYASELMDKTPAMSLDTIVKALTILIETL